MVPTTDVIVLLDSIAMGSGSLLGGGGWMGVLCKRVWFLGAPGGAREPGDM